VASGDDVVAISANPFVELARDRDALQTARARALADEPVGALVDAERLARLADPLVDFAK
jgi:hypothetical protein